MCNTFDFPHKDSFDLWINLNASSGQMEVSDVTIMQYCHIGSDACSSAPTKRNEKDNPIESKVMQEDSEQTSTQVQTLQKKLGQQTKLFLFTFKLSLFEDAPVFIYSPPNPTNSHNSIQLLSAWNRGYFSVSELYFTCISTPKESIEKS